MIDIHKKLNEDEIVEILNEVENEIDNINEEELKNIYTSNTQIIKDKNKSFKSIYKELENKLKCVKSDDINTPNNSMTGIKGTYAHKFLQVSNKIVKRLCKMLNSKVTKAILITGISIAWFMLYNYLSAKFHLELINPQLIKDSLSLHSFIENATLVTKTMAFITIAVSAVIELLLSFKKSLKKITLISFKYTALGLYFISIDVVFKFLYSLKL